MKWPLDGDIKSKMTSVRGKKRCDKFITATLDRRDTYGKVMPGYLKKKCDGTISIQSNNKKLSKTNAIKLMQRKIE